MDKYRPCPSIIAMFTSDSQHPPRSKHAVYLGVASDLVSRRRMADRLPGEQDCGQANGLGHSVS